MSFWDNKVHTPFDKVFDFDDDGELDPTEQAFMDDYLWQQWRANNTVPEEDSPDDDEFLIDDEEDTNEIEDLPGITREELECMDPADRRDFIQMNGLDPHMYENDEESALLDALEEAGYDMYDLMGLDLSGLEETLEAKQEEETINFSFPSQEEEADFPFSFQTAHPEYRNIIHPENSTGKIFKPGSLIYNEDEFRVIFRGLNMGKCMIEFFLINDSVYRRKAGAANILVNEIIPERYTMETYLSAGSYQTYTAAMPLAFLSGKMTDIHTISVKFVYEVYDAACQKMKIASSSNIFLQAGKLAF